MYGKVSKSPNRCSLVEYEMKKAGIFKSKLALIMYTLAQRCVFSLSNIVVTVFVFSYVWIVEKNRETKCETMAKERERGQYQDTKKFNNWRWFLNDIKFGWSNERTNYSYVS